MPTVQIGPWARNLALFSMFALVSFSIPCFFYTGGDGNGVYGIIVGVIFFPFLWPVWHLKHLLWFTQIYWVMSLLLAGLAVYPFFLTPTIIAGVLMVLSSILYLIAAIRREKTLSVADLAAADERLWMKM